MDERTIKQLTIALIFIVLVTAVTYGIYSFFSTDPTCYDQVKNNSEEGIDCGRVCNNTCDPAIVPLQIQTAQLIPVNDEFDFVAQVRNTNTLHGAENVSYDIILRDAAGQQLSVVKGTFYILPVQTKYIVRSKLPITGTPVSVDLVIRDATWNKVNAADLKIDFPLIREQHGAVSVPGVMYQVEGTLGNTSDFDFDSVDVAALLIDSSGMVQAVNTTTIFTFLSGSQRYFKVVWPNEISANGLTLQVQGNTNVFNNSNFIRRYGTQEEFQRYQ